MKRSEINAILREADAFMRSRGFYLPPFAYWTPEEWKSKGEEVREIVDNKLGWDITDWGLGDFSRFGLFLFTLRNGDVKNWQTCQGKLYAEKIMIVNENQVTPLHFHWSKMEDIINRGGGKLVVQIYNATPSEDLDEANPVIISVDGITRRLPAGGKLVLEPGESVTLPPYRYHKFWAEESRALVGEVSLVNDDDHDNRFYGEIGRFPAIEEDEPPLYLLVNDYARYYSGKPAS